MSKSICIFIVFSVLCCCLIAGNPLQEKLPSPNQIKVITSGPISNNPLLYPEKSKPYALKPITPQSGGVNRAAGGPDSFGYTYKDNNESGGPAYNWEDISLTGNPVSFVGGSDDGLSDAISIGFSFSYYGNTYTNHHNLHWPLQLSADYLYQHSLHCFLYRRCTQFLKNVSGLRCRKKRR